MANARFKAELRPSGRGGGGHLVEIPDEVVAALGGKGRIPVQATFNGVPYRGSIVKMGGVMMLGVTKAIMAEAGVVGAEDPSGLVKPHAFVVPKRPGGAEGLEAALARLCEEKLAPHQRPKKIAVVAELPRTATGKLQRFLLKDLDP